MKRKGSKALAATLLIGSVPTQVLAEGNINVSGNNQSLPKVEETSSITGKLEVDINFAMPIIDTSDNDMKLVLTGGYKSETVLLSSEIGVTESGLTYTIEKLNSSKNPIGDSKEISFIRVIFDKLPIGTYGFELSGSGYKTASVNNIDISTYSKRVKVGTKENEVVKTYSEDGLSNTYETYPALFLAGDVQVNDVIDMGDYELLFENIDSKDAKFDINKDGKTDIADLSYVKGSIGSEKDIPTNRDYIENTDAIINPDSVGVGVSEGAQLPVGVDIKDLLKEDTAPVKIETEQAPTAEKPLSIKMNLIGTSIPGEGTPGTYSNGQAVDMEQVVIKAPNTNGSPETGNIVYTDENGVIHTKAFGSENARITRNGDKEISIDLGSQVAVKEISIDVTGNRGNKNISEIAKIEFLNNVYKEVPKPVISIPTIKTLETSTNMHDERITISWVPQPNVTGYEVKYYKLKSDGTPAGPAKTLQTNKTNMNILDKQIRPYDTFRVSIQSLNGEWKSGYAEDLVNKDPEEGGLTEDKKKELIPYELDGIADNVNEKLEPLDSYYGTNGKEPNMGSVSDIQVVPKVAPEPPRNLKVNEGYRSLSVSWENHIQARDFDVYYRKVGSEDQRWTKANDKNVVVNENDEAVTNPDKSKLIRSHSYTLNGLDDLASYEVRATATNHLGTSTMSQGYIGTTETLSPPNIPDYKLINTPKSNVENGEIPTQNIISVENSTHGSVKVDSEFAAVDNDFSTNYIVTDWDSGATYHGYRGPIVEFDREYSIDRISLATSQQDGNFGLPHVSRIRGFDSEGNVKEYSSSLHKVKDANGKWYVTIKLEEPMTVKKLQVNLSVYSGNYVSISELKFHEADNIEQDLKNLYKDEFRIELKDGVTQKHIDDLRKRVNTIDLVSLEYNPDRTSILKELDIAQNLLSDADLSDEIKTLDTTINTKSGGPSLGMGNDWQSLGAVARPGLDGDQRKKIVVYVGSDNPNAKIQIGFLQTYGTPGEYIDTNNKIYVLGPGRHEITVPEIFSTDVEKGGQVMAKVYSANQDNTVKVRLANVDEIPHLNVNNIINDASKESEVKEKVRTYIRELKTYVANLPNMYPTNEADLDKVNNIYPYEPTTSALNNTDIEGDRFTLTMPATQILKGIEAGISGNENAQVERVYNALLAWEQQMQLTYAKKGVYESVEKAPSQEEYEKHKAPNTRMNIKYQRMMMGAAGYASGHHVGVGYGGASAYMQGVPFKFDENQNVINPNEGRLYGDLIAHEIGHVTDIGGRLYPETSNNLTVSLASSMLNQDPSKPGNIYHELYEKVTSNTMGLSTNRSVVLGMLWQPYLAYENEDTYKMLFTDNDTDPNNDSYFAKLNRAYRILTEEETKNVDRDQLIIRVTSKVVGKDLSGFYYAHGIMPNADTLRYVSQFPKEDRPIQYINDEARRQRLAGNADMASDTKLVASFGKDNKGNQILNNSYVNQDTVPITLSTTKDNDKILGYEIYKDGKPSGFVERNKDGGVTMYNDIVDNTNNRVFTYEAVAYDYNLNPTEKVTLGTVKVRHDGSVEKSKLDLSSNTIDVNDSNYDEHADNANPSLANILDNNTSSIYEGKKHDTEEDPYVIIDVNEVRSLAGIKYTTPTSTTKFLKKEKTSKSAIQNYEVQISSNGEDWTKVKEGQFKLDPNNPTETIYFDKEGVTGGSQLNVYNTRFVKLIAKGATEISVAELDLIAPPGDNIEIGVANDNINYKNGLGLLSEEFVYQVDNPATSENEKRSIPKGSVIITGEYRGNPAFNVPLVLNENEEHIADKYKGLLMANVPDNGNLEEIAEGNWVYWVEPQYVNQFMKNKEVFVELYRTDTADAQSGGQRLVSDTFKIEVPDELPSISLSGGQGRSINEDSKVIEIDSNTLKNIKNGR